MSVLIATEDLKYAMEYNNLAFAFEDINVVRAYALGERDSMDNWQWVVKLNNGCHYFVEGGCDYTGWDCQSWLEATVIESTAHLMQVIHKKSRDAEAMFEMLDKSKG